MADQESEPLVLMEDLEPGLSQEQVRSGWQRFSDHNPLFIISGTLMLGGCFLVSSATHELQDQVAPLLGAVAVLMVYEVLAIGLALWLTRSSRRRHERDALHLLVVAALLVVDGPLLFNELSMAKPILGAAASVMAIGMGVGKAWLVWRMLGVRPSAWLWALLGTGLGMIYAMPLLFRWVAADGFPSHGLHYAMWWAAGLLTAAHGLPVRWEVGSAAADTMRLAIVWRRIMLSALLLSTAGHAAAAHYLYGTPFEWVYASPLLLGLAVLMIGQARVPEHRPAMLSGAAIFLAMAALLSIAGDRDVIHAVTFGDTVAVSPMRLTLIGIFGACILTACRWTLWWWLSGSAGALMLLVLGASPEAISHTTSGGTRNLWQLLRGVVPRSRMSWGLVGIALAFVTLGLGAWWTLREQTEQFGNHRV